MALLSWLLPISSAAQDPIGDYGDAPDCPSSFTGFPTQFVTVHGRPGEPGVHHLTTGLELLGALVSDEAGAMDLLDPDGLPNLDPCPAGPPDQDGADDGVRFAPAEREFNPFVGEPLAHWFAAVVVTVAAGAPPGPRYLNVLSDVNGDGRWKNNSFTTEWVVRNARFDVAPGTSETTLLGIGKHPFGIGPVWHRFAITRDPIPLNLFANLAGWPGDGQYPFGETEDYLADGGFGVDPAAVDPGVNPGIVIPNCPFAGKLSCIPQNAGKPNGALVVNHCPTANTEPLGWLFEAAQNDPNDGECTVTLQEDSKANVPPIANSVLMPNAQIQILEETNLPVPVPRVVGDQWTVLQNDRINVELERDIGPTDCDLPKPNQSASFNLAVTAECCGRNYRFVKSCDAMIAHGGLLNAWLGAAGAGAGSPSDGGVGMGFSYISPTTPGEVEVHRLEGVPYVDPDRRALNDYWLIRVAFDFPFDQPPPEDAFITQYRFEFTDQELVDAGIAPTTGNKLLLVAARLDLTNFGVREWSLDVGASTTVDPNANVLTVLQPRSAGAWAIGFSEAFEPLAVQAPALSGSAPVVLVLLLASAALFILGWRRRHRRQ